MTEVTQQRHPRESVIPARHSGHRAGTLPESPYVILSNAMDPVTFTRSSPAAGFFIAQKPFFRKICY